MGWVFGLLQEKNGSLVLCEMYDMGKHGWGAAHVDWKQARQYKEMILKDLKGQFKTRTEFYVLPNNKINVKRKGKWSKRKVVPWNLSKHKWYSWDKTAKKFINVTKELKRKKLL